MRGSFGVGGERWSGDGGEDGEGGSECRGAREGSGLALKPEISAGRQRKTPSVQKATARVMSCLYQFITSTLEQDVKQVIHLLTVLLLREKNMF